MRKRIDLIINRTVYHTHIYYIKNEKAKIKLNDSGKKYRQAKHEHDLFI